MKLPNTHKYDDIIHLPHPVSPRHAPIPPSDRAAQFAPFAALSGYGAAIDEAGRLTEAPPELADGSIWLLDRRLAALSHRPHTPITVTWFQPDDRKDGGRYVTRQGVFKKTDEYQQLLLLCDGTKIPLQAIVRIEYPDCEND